MGRRAWRSELLAQSPGRSKLLAEWLDGGRAGAPRCGSTRRSSPPSAPACAGAIRTRTSSRSSGGRGAARDARRRCGSSHGPEARVHPQTVIEHFGTWNAAKPAGLPAGVTREELLEQLRSLGDELGRIPTARDLAARGRSASVGLVRPHVRFLANALREAGSRCSRARSGSSERSSRAPGSPARSAGCRRWPTGRRRAGATRTPLRVAGVPTARRPARRVDGVPVPRPRAAARRGV